MVVTGIYNFKPRKQKMTSSAVTLTPSFNIVGVAALMNITNSSGKVLLSLTNGSGLTVTDTTITIDEIQVLDIEDGVHTYDIEITFPDGTKHMYMKGTFKVEYNV